MTKLIGKGPLTLGRVLVLCSPALLLGACAPPAAAPCDACAAAAQAQATANQALSTAQQALAVANSSRTASSEMYQRSLQK